MYALLGMQNATCQLLVEMHEWATTRPNFETSETAAKLKEQVNTLLRKEGDQGSPLMMIASFISLYFQSKCVRES